MTNKEFIKKMNEEEFIDYVQSIFLAGRLYERYLTRDYMKHIFTEKDFYMEDLESWLYSIRKM